VNKCEKCKGTGRIDSGFYDHKNGSRFYDCSCVHKLKEEEKKQYMSVLIDLMRKNNITLLQLVEYGFNDLAEVQCLTDEQKAQVINTFCNEVKALNQHTGE